MTKETKQVLNKVLPNVFFCDMKVQSLKIVNVELTCSHNHEIYNKVRRLFDSPEESKGQPLWKQTHTYRAVFVCVHHSIAYLIGTL